MNFRDFEAQATAIDSSYRAELDALRRRVDLSPIGLAEAKGKLEAKRRQQIANVQQRARLEIEAEATRIRKAQAGVKHDRVAMLRQTLGDLTVASIYRRRLAAMTADELLQAQADAGPGFEATLISELAIMYLTERTAGKPDAAIGDLRALAEIQGRSVTPEQRTLDAQAAALADADRWLESLDLEAHRAGIADRLGVQAEYVPSPFENN